MAGQGHVDQDEAGGEGKEHVALGLLEFLGATDELDLVAKRQEIGGLGHDDL